MSQTIRIGMDTSKYIFQLRGVDASEQLVLRKRLSRKAMLEPFAKLPLPGQQPGLDRLSARPAPVHIQGESYDRARIDAQMAVAA